jgi:hypothetical protein
MVTRTAKIMGAAYATSGNVSVTVDYNGSRVFTGNVPTINEPVLPVNQPNSDPQWKQELGIFETDTDTTGTIPVKITVSGGRLFFGHFWMNYLGPKVTIEVYSDDGTRTITLDSNDSLDPEEPSGPGTKVIMVDTESYYGKPSVNSVETDGLTNTRLNGQSWPWRVNVSEDLLGDWAYTLSSGDVFEFDFYVDPNKIVLDNE